MTITRMKSTLPRAESFITAAPDAASTALAAVQTVGLKAKRGIDRSQVSIVLPNAVLARFDIEAERRYMSRSALITMLINNFLENGL